jgi:hypothetical protein
MVGAATAGRLRLELISPGGKDVKGPKHGKLVHRPFLNVFYPKLLIFRERRREK